MLMAEPIGVSPSQVSCHAKAYSPPKLSTPEQAQDIDAESECSGLSVRRHQLVSEIIQTENGDASGAHFQHGAIETLQPASEHVTNYLLTDVGPPPEDACENSLSDKCLCPKLTAIGQKFKSRSEGMNCEVDIVCALARPSPESKCMAFHKESLCSSAVPSSCIFDVTMQSVPKDVAKSSFAEDLVLPFEDTSKCHENDKSSSYHQTTSEQILNSPSGKACYGPSEEMQKPGSELVQNEPTEVSTGFTRCMSIEHLEPLPEPLTEISATGHLGLPSDGVINIAGDEQLQTSQDDVGKCSIVKVLETPSKDAATSSSRIRHKVKGISKSSRKKYMLRSFKGNERVLRSRSQGKSKAPGSSNNLPIVNSGGEKKRKKYTRRRGKKIVADEYSRIRKDLRYLLNRISYEQSLITAYSAEGWKGLSIEKLKPEKELQRASSEIFRRKLKIRDLFQRIDSLCEEGKLPASLFDSEGQIDSEDIFCAKCGSKDLTADNDIILCDGACDRGFHQFCLLPPLLKEDIPPNDEGWLCPGCDCKVDCIDLLNDYQGTNLCTSDTWEKIFPEAAVVAGGNPDHNFGLPSDDSDNDYTPDGPELDGKSQGDESSFDESDSTSASDGLEASPDHEQYLGLPSDDSEDNDYNPDAPDLEDNTKQESSSSDFTSDSEDLAATINSNELPTEDLSHAYTGPYRDIDLELGGREKHALNRELLSILETGCGQNGLAPVSGKRNIERLDYKQLYDETYGNVSSSSSDDEDFNGTVVPRKRRKRSASDIASMTVNGIVLLMESGMSTKDMKQDFEETNHTPKRKTQQNSSFENKNTSPAKAHEDTDPSTSFGKRVRSSTYKRLGEAVTQRLYNSFKENQYPDRATKGRLANELGLTFQQVDKWFGNARWSFNHSSSINSGRAESTSGKDSRVHATNEGVHKPVLETVARDAANNAPPSEGSPKVFAAAIAESRRGGVKKRNSQESGKKKSKTTPKSRRR